MKEKSKTYIKISFTIVIIIVLFVLFVRSFFNVRTDDYVVPNISLLSDSTYTVSTELALARNQFLINTLSQHQSILAEIELSVQNSRIQARLFYVTILAALISLFITKKYKIFSIIIGVTIVMYIYDTHLLDLEMRQHQSASILNSTKFCLVNTPPSSNVYYQISFSEFNRYNKYNNSDIVKRINRKLKRAFNPDFEQGIFYILPIILFLSFNTFKAKNKSA